MPEAKEVEQNERKHCACEELKKRLDAMTTGEILFLALFGDGCTQASKAAVEKTATQRADEPLVSHSR